MFRSRLGLLSLVMLAMFAALASSASAAIKFQWKVGGNILQAGETRSFQISSDGKTFDLHGSVAGAAVLFLSKEIEATVGSLISGGTPGTNEETVILKGVTVDNPARCVVESEGSPTGTIRTNLLHTEIVESEETHEPLILFVPKAGTVFVSLLLLNKSTTEPCAVTAPLLANITGTLLAQPLPQLTEVLNQDLDFEAPTKDFFLSNGTLDTAGLVFAGNAATLTGLALVTLNTTEKFGAF